MHHTGALEVSFPDVAACQPAFQFIAKACFEAGSLEASLGRLFTFGLRLELSMLEVFQWWRAPFCADSGLTPN